MPKCFLSFNISSISSRVSDLDIILAINWKYTGTGRYLIELKILNLKLFFSHEKCHGNSAACII